MESALIFLIVPILVYFDATQACHDLNFNMGQHAIGVSSAETNRKWSIKVCPLVMFCTYSQLSHCKVTQIPCGSVLKAPPGCTQYFYGSSGTGYIKTFNFDNNIHLANQNQVACVRFVELSYD